MQHRSHGCWVAASRPRQLKDKAAWCKVHRMESLTPAVAMVRGDHRKPVANDRSFNAPPIAVQGGLERAGTPSIPPQAGESKLPPRNVASLLPACGEVWGGDWRPPTDYIEHQCGSVTIDRVGAPALHCAKWKEPSRWIRSDSDDRRLHQRRVARSSPMNDDCFAARPPSHGAQARCGRTESQPRPAPGARRLCS